MLNEQINEKPISPYGITSIGVKGFKSLKDIPFLELKPMTILVGKNSCGKSSFLRILPLLKQSIEENIDGPLSLYGNYVDYGDFEDVLTVSKRKQKQFQFCIEGFIQNEIGPIWRVNKKYSSGNKSLKYSMSLVFKKKKNGNIYLSDIIITLGLDISLSLKIDSTDELQKVIINKRKMDSKNIRILYSRLSRGLLPEFTLKKTSESESYYIRCSYFDIKTSNSNLDKFIHKTIDDVDLLSLQSKEQFASYMEFFYKKQDDSSVILKRKDFISYENKIIFSLIPTIFSGINIALSRTIYGVKYSKPIRANAERYYRYKPLQSNEISPDGSNLAHVLSNLSEEQRNSFEDWMLKKFGFKVSVEGKSLRQIIIRKGEDKHNIVDMGYGYTQILPIIVQLWLSTIRRSIARVRNNFLFAIEQPELHLHPAMQKTLLQTFCNVISISKYNKPRFLLETHSKTFVMLLGELIEDGVLQPDDVSILVFNNENGRESIVTQSKFNEHGDLENWPIGFFG